MKKNRFTEFFKGKGYYVLLFVGVLAIAAVAFIGSQLSSKQDNGDQKIVDLNDTDNNIAAGDDNKKLAENNPVSDGVVNKADNTSKGTAAKDKAGQDVASKDVELDDYSQKPGTEQAQAAEKEVAKTEGEAVETAGDTVQADYSAAIAALSFKDDDVLTWPVQGNVIMNYSMDHTTYFATLMQYKVNPAIILDAEVGTEVKAATDGIVTAIGENEETGLTITMGIGDGYSLVYGQLDKDSVSLKVGSSVKEGSVIGKIEEPTNYYVVEGSNLFFEVMKDDQTVNPMLFLR